MLHKWLKLSLPDKLVRTLNQTEYKLLNRYLRTVRRKIAGEYRLDKITNALIENMLYGESRIKWD